MRIILASILLAVSLVFTGCQTATCDARGSSEVCEIHHDYMRTEMIVNPKHPVLPTNEYLEARIHLFAHSYPFILPNECDKCVVYVCDDCVRAEREWKRQHAAGK